MFMARHARDGGLPERQARFVREYLKDHNATQAYIRAGYSKKHADVSGPRLLGNVRIALAIAKADKKINDNLEITAERVRAEIAKRAFANMEDFSVHVKGHLEPDLSKCTRDQMAAVQEFTIDLTGGSGDGKREAVPRMRFKLADSLRALELLGRMRDLSLFDDSKVALTVSDEVLAALAEGRKRVACR